jgi:hypothetical protein
MAAQFLLHFYLFTSVFYTDIFSNVDDIASVVCE